MENGLEKAHESSSEVWGKAVGKNRNRKDKVVEWKSANWVTGLPPWLYDIFRFQRLPFVTRLQSQKPIIDALNFCLGFCFSVISYQFAMCTQFFLFVQSTKSNRGGLWSTIVAQQIDDLMVSFTVHSLVPCHHVSDNKFEMWLTSAQILSLSDVFCLCEALRSTSRLTRSTLK